jgi:type IV pilus assembly protein PilW
MKKITGVTLVELLITTVLALMLLLAANYFYMASKSNFNIQSSYSRLQENGRFAAYYLSNYLGKAGYAGCFNLATSNITNNISSPSAAFTNTYPVQGYDGLASSYSPTLSTAITGTPVFNSDVVTIHTTSNTPMLLTASMSTRSQSLTLNNTQNITQGQPVVITDCNTADLFMATNGTSSTQITHNGTLNQNANLSMAYSVNAEVLATHYYAYYVRNTGRVNANNNPIYALVQEDENNTITELVEGVEQMQILYAVNTDATSGPNSYQTAVQVNTSNNWNNVVGMQISLLISSIESVADSPQTYYFNLQTITPTDNKLRKQWDIFIPLAQPIITLE